MIEGTFGADVDYAMLVKPYGELATESPRRKYSPSVCIGTRRFTRLTNGFSKKFGNHVWMVALYTVYYNWIKVHKTLRVTPANAGGIEQSGLHVRRSGQSHRKEPAEAWAARIVQEELERLFAEDVIGDAHNIRGLFTPRCAASVFFADDCCNLEDQDEYNIHCYS